MRGSMEQKAPRTPSKLWHAHPMVHVLASAGGGKDGEGSTGDYFLYNNGGEGRLEMAALVEAEDTLLRLYLMKRREFGFLLELQISNAATCYASTLLPNM